MGKIRFCHVIDASTSNPLLYNSIKYSDRDQFEYTVIGLGPAGALQNEMEELGIRSFSLNYTSRKQSLSAWRRLYRFFRKEKISIVQTHLFNASLIGLSAAKMAGVPVRIFSGHHSHEVPLHKKKWLTWVDGRSGRWFGNHTIAPSGNMKEIFIKEQKIPARKVEVIPHGFDLEQWRSAAAGNSSVRKEFNIENKIVFGAVGRLFWVKDYPTMIEAFATFAADRDDIVLLIAGAGDDKMKLHQLILEKGCINKIFLAGKRTDISAVMNSFDIFLHTALAESFGMVFIEAMALGKPVISTAVGVAKDVIQNGRNGWLVKTGNVPELVLALRAMMEKKNEWPSMGLVNSGIADNYSVKKTQATCDGFYLKWLNETTR